MQDQIQSISLFRECIVTTDTPGKPTYMRSSRLTLQLVPHAGMPRVVTIRSRHTHVALRLAAAVLSRTSLVPPNLKEDAWQAAWEQAIDGVPKSQKGASWAAIYVNGEVVFENGTRDLRLDQIEERTAKKPDAYETIAKAVITEQPEPPATILLDSQPAISMRRDSAAYRISVLVRTAGGTSTFTIFAVARAGSTQPYVSTASALWIAADWMEILQITAAKRNTREQEPTEPIRVRTLSEAITMAERRFEISYRPERPDIDTAQVR